LPFQHKLAQLFAIIDNEEIFKLVSYIQTTVLCTSEPGKGGDKLSVKYVEEAAVPEHVVQIRQGQTVPGKAEKRQVTHHVWVKPFVTPVALAAPLKVKPDSHPLLRNLSWVNQFSAALGSSAIGDLTAGVGLMPGLSKSEADIIRFVTVAMNLIEGKGHITVQAGVSALTLLYSSVMRRWGGTKNTPAKFFKEKVSCLTTGLKPAARAQLSQFYGSDIPEGTTLVAWLPKAYTTKTSLQEVIKYNEEYYQEITQFPRRVVYREVLTPNENMRYYADGFPHLLTYWESTREVKAVTYLNEWGTESLYEVDRSAFFDTTIKFALQRLRHPFAPVMTRSPRVLAVRGDARIIVTHSDSDDVFELGTFVQDEELEGPAKDPQNEAEMGGNGGSAGGDAPPKEEVKEKKKVKKEKEKKKKKKKQQSSSSSSDSSSDSEEEKAEIIEDDISDLYS